MTMPAQPITAREIVTNLDVGPLQHRIIMRAFRGILSSAKGVLVMRKTSLAAALLLVAVPFAAPAMDITTGPDALKWGPGPPALPPGAQLAVVSGDPGKDGPSVLRAKLPAGYTVPPHSHPTDENVTELSGTYHFAMGDKLDKTKGETVSAGGFFRAEQGMHHYAWASSPVVIQIHGIGPFAITYVNPADDPRNKPSAQTAPSTSGSTTK
jgi:quercetin dioxygenase-like cupin family protein